MTHSNTKSLFTENIIENIIVQNISNELNPPRLKLFFIN